MNATEAPTPAGALIPPPDAILIEPSPTVEAQVSALLAELGLRVQVREDLPEDLSSVSLLLVEADRGSRTIALARQARSQRPDLPCAGVLRWWNEDERELAALVDFILHVPVRAQELQGLTPVVMRARSAAWQPLVTAVGAVSRTAALSSAALASHRREPPAPRELVPRPLFFTPTSSAGVPSARPS
jgi:hypothetical protein